MTATSTATPLDHPARPPRFIHLQNFGPAFWTIASLISLTVNVVLIVAVVVLLRNVFALKPLVSDQLVNGLYTNFEQMDQAHIRTNIAIATQVPARFDLPLETDTTVTLTQDTPISGARVSLWGGIITINNAPTDILLPAGTKLPVHLSLVVPVDQTIPVVMDVPVDIPLNQTELHEPFVGLQNVVRPFKTTLDEAPNSWDEALCDVLPSRCP